LLPRGFPWKTGPQARGENDGGTAQGEFEVARIGNGSLKPGNTIERAFDIASN
jgi:hypothetical protein